MKYFYALLILWPTVLSSQSLQSPSDFLGYTLGDRFTRHHRVVEYFEHVAKAMDNVRIEQYGETYEHRPLVVAMISSPKNMRNLEEIRNNNLKRTRLKTGDVEDDQIAIVWLSYNIHGNEASSIEAAMKTMHALANPLNEQTQQWLENTVVIIDPCINPDGRDRYANFYNQYGNKSFNPDKDDIEHHEPWPGGRANHYLFDLNRDWAWQTQTESAKRSAIYHQWMPHIHVDFHEQGYNNPYYFAPAAEPFHEVITPWQRDFQTAIGRNHAKYFDKEGWLYFTKESFDLLYPSYGDTYPTYNGAIGMTYEQAGHGRAGLGIITEYGDTLTLKDRIAHHYTTGISTVEIASENADQLTSQFKKYFDDNVNQPAGKYKSYIIKNSNSDKIAKLIAFLDMHRIHYGQLGASKSLSGFSYQTGATKSFTATAEDVVISSYQPMSRLITTLFEPVTKLSDTLTYDITAWSLPYAHGLDAYAVTTQLNSTQEYTTSEMTTVEAVNPYAYIAKYNSLQDVVWLADLLKKGVNVRIAQKPVQFDGQSFGRGSLIITRRNNEHLSGELHSIVAESAKKYDRHPVPTATGFADKGVDLGSSSIAKLKAPKIAVLAGSQTSSLNYGEIWHFFEQQINYPITSIGTSYFSTTDLHDYNVLIIPHGSYKLFDEKVLTDITDWVKGGGKLIIIGGGLNAFKDKSGFSLKEYLDAAAKKKEKPTTEEMLQSFESQERDNLSKYIFGAIFKVTLDTTHPLAYGYDGDYYSLKTNASRFSFLEKGANVGVLKGDPVPISGFAGAKALKKLNNSLVFGVESVGSGNVVYLVDNPLFRGFWENGKLLFSNAVFMVGH